MSTHRVNSGEQLVIIGLSNIVSDLLDAALALEIPVKAVVVDQPEALGPRDIGIQARLDAYAQIAQRPSLQAMADFSPSPCERYLLGPTTPMRQHLVERLVSRFGLQFCTLVHPSAYVSRLATLGQGVFVGANSVVAAGACLADHVFVNRGVTIGHDTRVGSYSRVQTGANLGGLTVLGNGVTVGSGATVLERLQLGEGCFVAAGAVVLADVPERVLVAGVPATIKKSLN